MHCVPRAAAECVPALKMQGQKIVKAYKCTEWQKKGKTEVNAKIIK